MTSWRRAVSRGSTNWLDRDQPPNCQLDTEKTIELGSKCETDKEKISQTAVWSICIGVKMWGEKVSAGWQEKFELRSKPETRTAPKLQAGHNSCLIWIKMWNKKSASCQTARCCENENQLTSEKIYVKGLHLKCVPDGHCVNMDWEVAVEKHEKAPCARILLLVGPG